MTRHFPAFTVTWLTGTSAAFLLLADSDGRVPRGVLDAVGFTPVDLLAAPWRVLLAPLALSVHHDAVQFAYVTGLVALAVTAFEAREGWQRTLLVFLAGGIGSALATAALVLLPLHALLATDLLAHAVTRAYSGASTAAFAVIGALAARAPTTRTRYGILGSAAAWELLIWAWWFRFAELTPVYHYAAIGVGFGLARTRLFEGLTRT